MSLLIWYLLMVVIQISLGVRQTLTLGWFDAQAMQPELNAATF